MIVIDVKTEKVYNYDESGMPKIEKIIQKLEDGANFGKFCKYLPYQGYLRDKTVVVKVSDVRKEGITIIEDVSPWQDMIKNAYGDNKKQDERKTPQQELIEERERNAQLMKRLEALEAKMSDKKEEPEDESDPIVDMAILKAEYEKLAGRKPHHLWKEDKLKSEINSLK